MNKMIHSVYLWLIAHRLIFEKVFFPILLVLYPFVGVFKGINLTDTTYALGGFLYPERMQEMWKLSTYLHHQTGQLLMRLPFGDIFIGMNFYTTMFISLSAIGAYYLLQLYIPAWMIFIGEWIAISLCWCPQVILYNYLTYLFFTFGMLFLVRGMTTRGKSWPWLLFAGICLGLNVMVRFPNVMETSTILIVIAYGLMIQKPVAAVIKDVLFCICGFCIGFLLPFTAISIQYGETAYADMIVTLFDMSKTATDYSGAGMLASILQTYGNTLSKMAILLPCMVAGVVLFLIVPEKVLTLKRVLYVAGLALVAIYLFKRRVFTLNYWYYDSFFQIAMMFLIFSILFYAIDLIGLLNGSRPERLLSAISLFMILILPLGSNNYTYPVMNCLFFIAPVSLGVFRRVFRSTCGVWSDEVFQKKKASIGRYFQNEEDMRHRNRFFRQHFVWVSIVVMMMALLIVQGTLFHMTFSFRDGMTPDETAACPMDTKTEIPKLSGMKTTAYNAEQLNNLYRFITEKELQGKETILFGDIPGLSYIMDLPPAIFSTWPDLDSVLTDDFDEALMDLKSEPLIIIKGDGTNYRYSERKYNLLLFYMQSHLYQNIYDDGTYRIYLVTDSF